jgi:hypothetical protein
MTGAAIVRWESAGSIVLAVHGAFDGASAWVLRNDMDESPALDFVIDLTQAVEACDFAACLLANWARSQRNGKRVRFKPGSRAHAALLTAHGLELLEDEGVEAVDAPFEFPLPWSSRSPSGAPV